MIGIYHMEKHEILSKKVLQQLEHTKIRLFWDQLHVRFTVIWCLILSWLYWRFICPKKSQNSLQSWLPTCPYYKGSFPFFPICHAYYDDIFVLISLQFYFRQGKFIFVLIPNQTDGRKQQKLSRYESIEKAFLNFNKVSILI